ncbi:DDX4-like protein [Mya arenaria]|uniref:RNA helicase n=1 Tax=Mya arenaria TaxID=6604 RepID=A0ABY7FUY8_MYAAR|nr:DDX4-like protein [Mya arenaria]
MADEDWDTPSAPQATGGFGGGFGRGVLRTDAGGSGDSGSKPGFGSKTNGFGGGGAATNGFGGGGRGGSGFGGGRGGGGGFGSGNTDDGDSGAPKRGGFGGGGFGSRGGGRGGFGGGAGGFGSSGGDENGDSGAPKRGGFGGGGGRGGFGGGGGGFGSSGGDRPPRGGGFGSSSSGEKKPGDGCFKCGESGHFSRECPNAEKKSGGDGCFKCGESGHFSRECPNAGSGGGGGGGGDRNCFKCGESGHFARECPKAGEGGGGITLDPERPPPYVPPTPPEDEEEIFKSIMAGINFDNFDKIPVEVTGRDAPPCIGSFDEAGLYNAFLENVKKAKYSKPTPFSAVQEPQALVVAPTRELAVQIYMDARKFAHGTMLRPVVLYGGTSVGHQLRQVQQGCHILVGTPGRLLDVFSKGKVSLEKLKYLILDEADRMLDMGFGPDIRRIIEEFRTPDKTQRQTLMFSATFPQEIQRLAAEYLNDYLFLTIGNVGGANTDVSQHVYEVDRLGKREKLVEILTDAGKDKVLVFVEQKRNADFLASYLSQTGFPTTSIHGDRLQMEREEALLDFKTGKCSILIATSVAARGLDIPMVKQVINYDLPSAIEEYVHRIGRTGRCGNLGSATSFYNNESDSGMAKALVKIFAQAGQVVPEWLENYAKGAISTAGYVPMGGKFGGKDIRRDVPRTRHEGEAQSTGGSFGGGFNTGMGGGGSSAFGGAEEEESWD